MKKLILSAVMFLPLWANALNITDPFFMPASKQVISDTSLGFTNNAFKLNKSWGIYEKLSVGVNDNLTAGLSIGWADMRHEHSGMQDLSVFAKYRFAHEHDGGYFFDFEGYLSPKLFNSPYNGKNGSAKGSTDLGLRGTLGSTQIMEGFTLGAGAGFQAIGHTDLISSGSIWDITGFGRYYFNEYNALGVSLGFKGYWGFDQDFMGINLGFDYSADIIENKLALVPYFNVETHNHEMPSSTVWGLNARYIF